MASGVANALVEKQRTQLVDMHKDGCPWKTRQCDRTSLFILLWPPFHAYCRGHDVGFNVADIYRIPVSSPAAMARDIKIKAIALETVLQGVEVTHPLVRLVSLLPPFTSYLTS